MSGPRGRRRYSVGEGEILNAVLTEQLTYFRMSVRTLKGRKYGGLYHSYRARGVRCFARLADERLRDVDACQDRRRQMRSEDSNRNSLVQTFRQTVETFAARVALISEDRQVTCGELDGMANQFARVLRSRGAAPRDLVAVSLDRSVDAFVVLLGILKAGCTYVPLDPSLPALRRTAIAADARARLLVVTRGDFLLPEIEAPAILYSEIEAECVSLSSGDVGADSADVCCVLYTSGTTGAPKGVAVPGSAILNHASWMWRAYPFRDGDVALIHRSCVYMAATWDYFGPLLGGAPSLIAPGHGRTDPAVLFKLSLAHGVSHVSGSPGFWRTLLDRPQAQLEAWHTLRLGTTSGEELPVAIVADWRRAFPRATLLNVYGITEAVRPAVYDTAGLTDADARVPIGTPLPNVEMRIVDERLENVETGTVGEICVAGACLTRGYLHPEAGGSGRFFADSLGRTMFRTGDLARLRPDGHIELVGRIDHQVKIRGFRVELEEIEMALHACPAVRQAAVVAHRDRSAEKGLIAYVVPSDGTYPSWRDLDAFLRTRLPDFMVPASFVLVDEIPLTPSGKVDRQTLSVLDSPVIRGAVRRPEPMATATEAALARIWSDVIGVPGMEATNSFLELGGHSLMAMRIATQVELAFGVELPLETFFPNPTLRAMAAAIDRLRDAAGVRQA
jgi:amino acid adenylation domain-containing protein